MLKLYYLLVLTALCLSCSNKEQERQEQPQYKGRLTDPSTKVKTAQVLNGIFSQEIVSNGKTLPERRAEIKSYLNECTIKTILVANGQFVKKGELIALLDDRELKTKFLRSSTSLAKARIDLDDRLIDYGFRLKDSLNVPKDIMMMAKNKSGYFEALYLYADALKNLGLTKIVAPFNGTISDLEAIPYNEVGAFKKICNLNGDETMRVDFKVLESEYRFLGRGAVVMVMPFSTNYGLKGNIAEINPVIDENGLIKVSCKVSNENGKLINGMNVKVIVSRPVSRLISVPKGAVVKRQGRDVVFTAVNGRAKWNYVTTGAENTGYVVISSGLNVGEKAIVSNNTNLADQSKISIEN